MSAYHPDLVDSVQLGSVILVRRKISLKQEGYHGGMSIPFVDPWERSSISLLGTGLMRPGILPFILYSLQLGTAHSFRYGHNRVCLYTQTQRNGLHAPTPLQKKRRKKKSSKPLLMFYCKTIQDF